jgi:hypothetical protein
MAETKTDICSALLRRFIMQRAAGQARCTGKRLAWLCSGTAFAPSVAKPANIGTRSNNALRLQFSLVSVKFKKCCHEGPTGVRGIAAIMKDEMM